MLSEKRRLSSRNGWLCATVFAPHGKHPDVLPRYPICPGQKWPKRARFAQDFHHSLLESSLAIHRPATPLEEETDPLVLGLLDALESGEHRDQRFSAELKTVAVAARGMADPVELHRLVHGLVALAHYLGVGKGAQAASNSVIEVVSDLVPSLTSLLTPGSGVDWNRVKDHLAKNTSSGENPIGKGLKVVSRSVGVGLRRSR